MSFRLLLLFMALTSGLKAQYKLRVNTVHEKINIDGHLNEASWSTADSAHRFWQNFPYDTSFAETRTVVRIMSDRRYLYIGAVCHDTSAGKYVITSLKRDFLYASSDAFSVHINPFNDLTNGFSFTVSPYGVQSEGLIQNGGGFGVSNDWDNRWYSETVRGSGGYTVEIAIPFKSIRFSRNDSSWCVNFSRNNMKRNENSSWKPVPRNMNVATLVNTGRIFFETLPSRQKLNAALIPYAITSFSQPDSRSRHVDTKPNAGMDAKIVLTPSLNLDLTVNPDFAQVEVDRQVINLSRFSLFFPERRQFFLENSDLFASFGFRQIRPFFSRMIGLERGVNIPISYGARISGKLGRLWRIGAMNIQTGSHTFGDGSRTGARNFSVAAFQRQVFGSSNIAGIFVNRFDVSRPSSYNRVAGLDYNLQSRSGKWLGKAFWHQSFGPGSGKGDFANATWLFYTDKKFNAMWNHEYVSAGYNAATGFVPRTQYYDMRRDSAFRLSYYRFEPEFSYNFFPKSTLINRINTSLYADIYRNGDFSENDAYLNPNFIVRFQNSALAGTSYNFYRTRLMYHTDVLGNGRDTFFPGTYEYGSWDIYFQSNKRKIFSYYLSVSGGGFFDGRRNTGKLEMSLRLQPRVVLGLISSFDLITLPDDSSGMPVRRSLQLVSPSFEFSLSRKFFITTYIQYNSQTDNININGRLQYRFRPMSDLFVVYSDNYFTNWSGKNRALTLKLAYWLNT